MVKFMTKTMCVALMVALCIGSLSAQFSLEKNQVVSERKTAIVEQSNFSEKNDPGKVKTHRNTSIFSEGFETATGNSLPAGWVSTNQGTGEPWITTTGLTGGGNTFLPYNGQRMACNLWKSNHARNAWMFSPGFALTQGVDYEISFWLCQPGYPSYGEHDHFEVKIGQTATPAGMATATTVYYNTTQYVPNWTKITYTFSPSATGTYYLGFRAFTPADEGDYIAIDDIEIIEAGGTNPGDCDPPTNLNVVYNEDCEAVLTWSAPAKNLATPMYLKNPASHILDVEKTSVALTASSLQIDEIELNYGDRASWLTWANDPTASVVGTGAITFGIYHRYTAADLASYVGQSITKIRYQPYNHTQQPTVFTVNPKLQVYVGGSVVGDVYNPGTLVVDYTVPSYTFNVEQTVDLPTPVLIDGTQEVWFGIFYTPTAGYPGCATNGTHPGMPNSYIQDKSNIFFLGGTYNEWGTSLDFFTQNNNNKYCWTHAAWVENVSGGDDILYNIYRDGTLIASNVVATTYTDSGFDTSVGHTWEVKVACEDGGESNAAAFTIDLPCDIPSCAAPKNLEVSFEIDCSAAKLTWEAPTSGKIELLKETFATGTLPSGWLNLDVDGDGWFWQFELYGTQAPHNPMPSQGRTDEYSINSASYYNGVNALSPNNWLITPALELDGTAVLTYWVRAMDANYVDHYGVYISTTGTNPTDFTLLFSETLPANTNWNQKTVNITQTGTCYIAFRHFNSYDKYIICLDDIIVTKDAEQIDYNYNVYRDGDLIATVTTTSYTDNDFDYEQGPFTWSVRVICDDDTESNAVSVTDKCNLIAYPPQMPDAKPVGNDVLITWLAPDTRWATWSVSDKVAGRVGYAEDTGAEMEMAHRFTPADLAAIGIVAGDKITEMYLGLGGDFGKVNTMSIRIWEGGTAVASPGTLVYTQSVNNIADLKEDAMNKVVLDTPFEIDPTKELRIGYMLNNAAPNPQGGYPIGRDAGPTVSGKGTMFRCPLLQGGNWFEAAVQYSWNWNWSLKALIMDEGGKEKTLSQNRNSDVENYIVYRLFEGDEEDEDQWEELANDITGTSYLDDEWSSLCWGVYRWAIKAQYSYDISEPVFSNTLDNDMYVMFTVNLTTDNGAPVNGAKVSLVNQSGGASISQIANVNTVIFPSVRRGIYNVLVELENFHPKNEENVDITEEGSSIDVLLEAIICPEVENLTAEYFVEDIKVYLNWEAPSKKLGYKEQIFENNEGQFFIPTNVFFTPSILASEVTFENIDDPAKAPNDWIMWCGSYTGNISGPTSGIVAARFLVGDLASNAVVTGDIIRKVKFLPLSATAAYTIHIYAGGTSATNPGELVYQQPVTQQITPNAYNEVILNPPYVIDASKELWIGVNFSNSAGGNFHGADNGPRVVDKGDILFNAGQWTNLYAASNNVINRNWNLEAFVEEFNLTYNVFRNGVKIGTTQETCYVDNALTANGVYEYCVSVNHMLCTSAVECEDVYVWGVGINQKFLNNVVLYYNKENNVVKIEGENVTKVKVYNSIGQTISNYEKTNTINLSNYKAGVYVFTVTTETGKVENYKVVIN